MEIREEDLSGSQQLPLGWERLLDLTIKSAEVKIGSAPSRSVAPAAAYSASGRPEPTPAPASTITWWPWWTSSATDEGTNPTRSSWSLISFGTPICMLLTILLVLGGSWIGNPYCEGVHWTA